VVAKLLAHPQQYAGQTFVLTGSVAVSDTELAALASKAWGRQIAYVDVAPAAFRKTLDGYGMPDWQASSLSGLQQLIRDDHVSAVSPAVEQVLGKPPRKLEAFLQAHPLQ
jgi:uncharacterized protein YbjT (DUF2867 family)